jgi:hypothetical protein
MDVLVKLTLRNLLRQLNGMRNLVIPLFYRALDLDVGVGTAIQ